MTSLKLDYVWYKWSLVWRNIYTFYSFFSPSVNFAGEGRSACIQSMVIPYHVLPVLMGRQDVSPLK